MAAKYKALTYLMLGDVKKAPGDPVTDAELKDAGQSENVEQLMADGALGKPDDEINEAHVAVAPEESAESDQNVTTEDGGSGK